MKSVQSCLFCTFHSLGQVSVSPNHFWKLLQYFPFDKVFGLKAIFSPLQLRSEIPHSYRLSWSLQKQKNSIWASFISLKRPLDSYASRGGGSRISLSALSWKNGSFYIHEYISRWSDGGKQHSKQCASGELIMTDWLLFRSIFDQISWLISGGVVYGNWTCVHHVIDKSEGGGGKSGLIQKIIINLHQDVFI